MTSFGGVLNVADVVEPPDLLRQLRAGDGAGRRQGVRATTTGNVIVCDMGGTSFDVSVIRDGYIKFTRETWLGARFVGHITGLSSVDVKSIGAGGGSIAWIDSGGLLRVGPAQRGRGTRARLLRPRRRPSRR